MSDHGQDFLVKMDQACQCPLCCDVTTVGPTRKWETRLAISPDREVFGIADDLYKIDTLNGNSTLIMDLHGLGLLKGLIAMGGGIFYTMECPDPHDAESLIKIDVVGQTITNLGALFPKACGDMCFFEGEIYYPSTQDVPFNLRHIARMNLTDPGHGINVAFVPLEYWITGVCATDICNTLIAVDTLGVDQLVYINLKDGDVETLNGAVTPMCSKTEGLSALVSMQELKSPTICNSLDLDCNDSSLAFNGDFNADTFDCLSSHVRIVDTDVQIFQDTLIEEIRIRLTGFIPDGTDEYIEVNGASSTVMISGAGTQTVTLQNGGPATFPNFNYLLQRMYYNNDALYPTAGTRTIEVQFITALGTESEISTAFIPVVELPIYPVELGDTIVKCENESAELNAYSPGAGYHWSTGSSQSTIFVNDPGFYSVHVYGLEKCPNWDTVFVTELPVVEVGLGGDAVFCGDEQPELYLNVNSTFHLDITLTTSDTSFVMEDISGSQFLELDIPLGTEVTFTITDVISSPDACIEINNDEATLGLFPSYEQLFHKSICDGDSILIGFEYESVAGTYDKSFYTEAGCDSNVTIELSVLPLSHTYSVATSCDLTETGIFNSVFTAANGCDSIHQKTVTYLASDTTYSNVPACRMSDTGVFQSLYVNQDGCDSLVITQVYYQPPADSTQVALMTCNENELGTFTTLSTASDGCDSVTITSVVLAPTDTTYLFSSSCNPGNIGVFESLLTGADGCDSLVISTVTFSLSDTTYTTSTSCDSASLGVFEFHYTGTDGCDSTIFNTVTYSAHDSVFLFGTSCNPGDAGVFINQYINQFGCDSVVTMTVSLLPTSTTSISSTTCDPSMTGTFTYNLTNQSGCDSIVTETITLLPASETFLSSATCKSSEAGVFVDVFTAQNGCDSIVTLTVLLVPEDTTQLHFKTCNPDEVGDVENTFTNIDGCDSLVISTFDLFPLSEVDILMTSDFNGYGVSCFGESDGSLFVNVTGSNPFIFEWSTGQSNQELTNLSGGSYAVTVIDANGCETSDMIHLTEPPIFNISTVLSEPGCFGQQSGSIEVIPQGGVPSAHYSLDGINFQSSTNFNNLKEGIYNIVAEDANGCTDDETVFINVPLQVSVELGDDYVVEIGDTAYLNAIISVPEDSLATVIWTGLVSTDCPTCLSQQVVPSQNATYSISVTTRDGCTDEDEITIRIGKHTDILVPNIFSPNGDGQNDLLFVTAGKEIDEIASFAIYDRWGNLVYHDEKFPPNDPGYGWNGTWNGNALNSGVFAYQLIATLKNGKSRIVVGNTTIIR